MRTLSAGRASKFSRGITLVEMMLVVAIVGMIVGISFPSISGGLETIRLNSAADALAGFFNSAMNRAERRQEPIELVVSLPANRASMQDASGRFSRTLEIKDGVAIRDIRPGTEELNRQPRRFLLLPGGTPPAIAVELQNTRGGRRLVRVDPITGAPHIERVAP